MNNEVMIPVCSKLRLTRINFHGEKKKQSAQANEHERTIGWKVRSEQGDSQGLCLCDDNLRLSRLGCQYPPSR